MGELSLTHLLLLAMFLPAPFALCAIAKKAGYPQLLGLLMMIPIFNLAFFYVFAFSKWPSNVDNSKPHIGH